MATSQIDYFLSQSRWLWGSLWVCWVSFFSLAVVLAAFCFSFIFLPHPMYLPLGILEILMIMAGLRLLSVALASLHDRLGLSFKSEPERAEWHFKWALRLTPGNPDLFCNWGETWREHQNFTLAQELFERALQLQPDYDVPYVQLAYVALYQGQWREACRLFDLAYRLRRGVAWNDLPDRIPEETPQAPQAHSLRTTVSKLEHDAQQLAFLLAGRYLPATFQEIQQAYAGLLHEVQTLGPEIRLSKAQHARICLTHGRNFYVSPVPAFPRAVLNADLNLQQIQQDYAQAQPPLVVVDNLLEPDALEALLHFCQKSSIWHDDARPGAYLGAYMDDGFNCDLLYQVAHELQLALPEIIQGEPLKHMWAYKYDSQANQGIGVHADSAKINVNFWVTPDHANLEPEQGGLLIYNRAAPSDWEFSDYNQDTVKTESFLAAQAADLTRIPYRQNRAAIFDSRLFHATDTFHFKPDYLLRRINITFLFG